MERETARKKEAMEKVIATPATPATSLPEQTPAPQPSENPALLPTSTAADNSGAIQASRDVSQAPQTQDDAGPKTEESTVPTEAQKDIPQESIEVNTPISIREQSWLTFSSHLVLRF